MYAIYASFRGVSKHLCSQCENAEDAAAFSANRKVVNFSYMNDVDGNYVGPVGDFCQKECSSSFLKLFHLYQVWSSFCTIGVFIPHEAFLKSVSTLILSFCSLISSTKFGETLCSRQLDLKAG